MVRGKELTIEQRTQITSLREEGLSYAKIAKGIGIPASTVAKTVQKYNKRGSHQSAARSGRPRKWTDRDDRYHVRETLKNASLTWKELSAALGGVPTSRLQRAAYKEGVHRRAVFRNRFVSARDGAKRNQPDQ